MADGTAHALWLSAMTPHRTLIPLIALVATACLKLPEIGSFQVQEDAGTPATEQPQPDAGSPGGTLSSVRLLKPTGTVFTNGTLDVQVELVGSPNTLVELVLDGKDTVGVLEPPAYKLTWNTASIPEGPHLLTARAVLGSKTLVSAARTVTVDRTPPQLVLRTPAPNAQEVSVHEPIYAVFSEAVRAETLTDSSVRLTMTGGTTVARTVSLSSDGKTLRVQPAASPVAPATMMLNTTNAITDLAGNGLASPSEAWIWNVPAWISTGVSPDASPEVASLQLRQDSSGGSVMAFSSPDGDFWAVYKDNAGNWRSLSPDPRLPASGLPYPSGHSYVTGFALQLDNSTTPVLAYSTGASKNDGNLISIRRWQDNDWRTIGTTNFVHEPYAHNFITVAALQLTSNGMPVVAWMGSIGYNYLHVHRWTGSTWEKLGDHITVENDSPSGDYKYSPSLRLNASNNPVIAWSELDGKVYVSQWSAGSRVWSTYGQGLSAYPQLATPALNPSLQLDIVGSPIIAWRQADSTGTKHIHVRRWSNGVWQDMGTALRASPGITDTSAPELHVDPSNKLILSWSEMAGGIMQTHFRVWNGTQWEMPVSPLNGDQFSISLDAQGGLVAAKAVEYSILTTYRPNN
ncbi:MAG TPA: Ig-like domain-containing protein [Archangium sp.]|nr:Ig-like domain-containing protein [Archangium sp.]